MRERLKARIFVRARRQRELGLFGVAPAFARPERACAFERTALPIQWMGPSLAAGLGGPSSTARATTGAKVRPPRPPACATLTCPIAATRA